MPMTRPTPTTPPINPPTGQQALATFGGGCFWCTEAVYEATNGVSGCGVGLQQAARSLNPTYEAVCTGATGHAEVIQVTYDPDGDLLQGAAGDLLQARTTRPR